MMIIKHRATLFLSLALATTLMGCATGPAITGSHLLVTPVVYEYSVTVKNKALQHAQKEISAYLEQNEYALLVHGATISWNGRHGKTIAKHAQQWLIKRGISLDKLLLSEAKTMSKSTGTKQSNVTLSTTIHQVQNPACGYAVIGQYHRNNDGCIHEAMRWESMVYPENKLAGQGRLSIITPDTL
ncbi:hypothetical protein A1OO_16705 [Enterovibrio norvegicus FF-33]|uniref:Lipoprotein n=1 Tax=Enterovibrio norvegicus FF-454 TaxID=1185651 RepID=A0A1E5C5X0_9GAMM|nr:hypothetical protein [Enterovibrio norvegicus]OEE60839.1 hypothetical protein A1OK_09880 [Enterovibrio norvegicus FF-454]OEE67390.1 hypothetical protein A1OO_16705 [Enterovibrio norvegicus FF-33]OEE74546.1 hypothetical protein A1OQ_08830 [Enterovibrio norvegicus FF-162]